MENTIKVSVARMGTPIQTVELQAGSLIMDALRKLGYDLDSVRLVKLNGSQASLDQTLADGNVMMVSVDKVKAGSDCDEDEGTPISLAFDIKEDKPNQDGKMMFLDCMSTFEIIKQVMRDRGTSMNYFKELRDSEGNKIGLDSKLEDGQAYTIIIEVPVYDNEEDY